MANIHPGTDVGWGSETPTAAELWAQARTGLFQAGKLAKTASEKGWEKGWSAATVMSAALRARLEQARVAQPPDEEVGAVSAEFAADPAPASQAGRAPAAESHRPSVAVKAKTGRSVPAHLLLRGARSLAAPLAACAAAAIVYQAGSHFLGSASDIALSKSAPAVPELGELQSPAVAPATRTGASAPPGKSAGSGPPAMQVESTEMPQGLSWPGKGLIEVVTAEDELIYVDGVFTGRGPLRRVPVTPGEHEVRIKQDGSERSGAVSVELDRCTRAVFAQSP
jgi:hypothetical protein